MIMETDIGETVKNFKERDCKKLYVFLIDLLLEKR